MSNCPVCNVEFATETNDRGYVRSPYDQTRYHYYYHLLEDIALKRSAKTPAKGEGENTSE